MEAKKKLLIKVLKKIEKDWDMAEWFLTLLQSQYCDEQTVNELSRIIFHSLKKTSKKIKWNKTLEKWLNILEKIHQEEFDYRAREIKEIEKLLENL